MRKFAWIILLFINTAVYSQKNDELDSSKVYNSIAKGLKNPEHVFHLDLSKQKLKELPGEVHQFKNLITLNLEKNKLKSLPEMRHFKKMEELNISNNKFKNFPIALTEIYSLKKLDVGGNDIVDLPKEILRLKSLEYFSAWGNDFTEIPVYIKEMQHLKEIDFRAMMFSYNEQDTLYKYFPTTEIKMDEGCDCD